MPFWRFTIYTTLGVLPWCFGLAAAGLALGAHWHTVVRWFLPVSVAVAIALVGWLALWARRRVRARRASASV
jgi:membrane protein DedA with SNARE-associated domain